jgi:hypothetical protein
MEITTQGILSLFETTKAERATFTSNVLERIEEGQADPIRVHLQLKAMEEIVKTLNTNERYKELLLDAAQKSGKKFMAFNAEFQVKEMGQRYDFTYCGDDELLEFYSHQEKLKYLIKEREEFLKKVPVTGMQKVTESGEVITLFPPSKTSTTTAVSYTHLRAHET